MYLKEETKRNIERIVGLPFEQIQCLTLEEESEHIAKRTKSQLRFSTPSPLVCTGEPLLTLGRYRTMEEVDAYFDKMFPVRSCWWKFKAKLKGRKKCR
ncbi:MAG: hypothetical protein IJZ68_05965 [Bacteroidaceae bacterium]|nr:hypothetical protein [Bacteroidaceae bacterium]